MTELIITEKPSQSEKIAQALSDKKPTKKVINKVPYYEITHNKKKIIIGCAVGHLYNLAEKKKSFMYPSFDLEWKPSNEISKNSEFSKKYLTVLKKIVKDATEFTVACDYDTEGSLIGYNIIRFVANKKDANRMKFSTLTKNELIESYDKKSKHLDFHMINSGETRHYLDYFYGINISRALMSAVKAAGSYKTLSSGRVQGPALKVLAARELEIRKFKPKKYWQLQAINSLELWHEKDKFFEKDKADKIYNNIKNEKSAKVKSSTTKEFYQEPPNPFDLTSLQLESYRLFKITPKQTLDIAQELYTKAYTSYPRTSSNQIPESINYKELIKNLSKQTKYEKACKFLLSKKVLAPNNGKKKDPAHPAIYPTGEIPKKLSERSQKIYDLIVKRTLASFSEKAKRQTVHIKAEIKGEIFAAKGTTTIEKGWHSFYEPYVKQEEHEMPNMKEGGKIKLKKINKLEKETTPPTRYSEASIIKELENKNLGTKATRAAIIEALYQRDYITGKSIEVTDLGLETIKVLDKYIPEIIDEKLTRHFEEELEEIIEDKSEPEKILEESKQHLTKILTRFKKSEKEIGKELIESLRETQNKASIVGECPVCKKGELKILYSRRFKSYFIACNQYPQCKTTFSLTQGLPKPMDKKCEHCGFPLVQIIRKGTRPFNYCFNKQCPKRIEWMKENKKKVEEFRKKLNKP
ncbi:DNA topoisomerase I [Candidatus Woesearchaeota archaeon]|nr:DNA topoisomerase I [Candidatus Woesearchaeota archaeon]